ncbi:hypothetical protein [Pseudarthrobacter sp. WHRI 8279]|uniref:hypothetical protein n=1 Tax=Pseudarthrobacter sp. WHRI 8279 TaxID=3162566 RepID=UPI0032EF7178
MSVETMRWIISVLTALGFILPAIGIGHTFVTVIQKRQAQDRARALKAEIDAKYERLQEANGHSVDLYNAKISEYRTRNVPFATNAFATSLVEEAFYGNVGERLSVAKKDLVFVFGGALSATVASIWSVWIPSGG